MCMDANLEQEAKFGHPALRTREESPKARMYSKRRTGKWFLAECDSCVWPSLLSARAHCSSLFRIPMESHSVLMSTFNDPTLGSKWRHPCDLTKGQSKGERSAKQRSARVAGLGRSTRELRLSHCGMDSAWLHFAHRRAPSSELRSSTRSTEYHGGIDLNTPYT